MCEDPEELLKLLGADLRWVDERTLTGFLEGFRIRYDTSGELQIGSSTGFDRWSNSVVAEIDLWSVDGQDFLRRICGV